MKRKIEGNEYFEKQCPVTAYLDDLNSMIKPFKDQLQTISK